MKAVIFCDPSCDWLAPLQGIRKAELPLCGRPLLAYLLALLAGSGAVGAFWLADASPALQRVAAAVSGLTLQQGAPPRVADADTLVVRNLGLLDCDFSAALRSHRQAHNDCTLLTLELPSGSRAPRLRTAGAHPGRGAGYADTGYAILRAGCAITPHPLQADDDAQTALFAAPAVWEPVSSVASYLRCQQTLLRGWLEAGGHKRLDGLFTPTADSFPQARLAAPVFLGHRVRIGVDSVLADTVVGNGVTIGSGASLQGCTVHDGAYIGDGVQARDAFICAGAMLMHGCRLEPGCAVGEGASVGEHAVIEAQVRVFAGKRVAPRTTAELDVRHSTPAVLELEEERVCGQLTASSAVRLGTALAQTAAAVAIGFPAGQAAAQALCAAVAAGCASAGGRPVLVPDTTLPALCCAAAQAHAEVLLHLEAGAEVCLRLFAAGGLPLTALQEAQLEAALDTRSVPQLPPAAFGEWTTLSSSQALYELALVHRFPNQRRSDVTLSTADVRLRQLGARLFAGGTEHAGLLLQLSADGRQLAAYSDRTGFVRAERLQLLCCLHLFAYTQTIALPDTAPQAAETLAAQHGCTVVRYHTGAGEGDAAARSLALTQRFTLDGLFAAGLVLEHLTQNRLTLEAALAQVPVVHVANRIYAADAFSRAALRRFCKAAPYTYTDARGRLTVRPSRSGKSLNVSAEADSMEAATELVAEAARLCGE